MLPHVTDMAVEIIGVRFGMETRPDLYHMTPAGGHVSCTGSPLSLVGFTQGHFSKGHSNFFIIYPSSTNLTLYRFHKYAIPISLHLHLFLYGLFKFKIVIKKAFVMIPSHTRCYG